MNKLINRLIFLLICSLFVISCANKPLHFNKGVEFTSLKLCLNFSEDIEADGKLMYLDALNKFIDVYNAQANTQVDAQDNVESNKLQLKPCGKSIDQSLIITVQKSLLIEPKKQAFYVAISTVGIAYPLSGGSIGFAWFAMNGTNLQFVLSSDLSDMQKPVHRNFSSWPYFYDIESLKVKHMEQFQAFMFENMEEIEKNLALAQM